MNGFLEKGKTALWIVDVQEKLFSHIDRKDEVLDSICFFLKAALILKLPLVVTEQYPKKLGPTVRDIKELLPPRQPIWEKTLFSGYADKEIRASIDAIECTHWILIGIEAHICILQTAKDLLASGKSVVVLNDAVSSRSLYDYSTAISELRDVGTRVSNVETVVYELVRDGKSPEYKELLPLIKHHD
ncbi:MAG: isochorismatase family protein [Chlamydiales bacterium]